MRVLVLRFSSIGDIVLTTPVLRALKIQLSAEVHFLTKPAFVSMMAPQIHLDQIHAWQPEQEIIKKLKALKFDLVVDLHNNLRSRRVCAALGVPVKRYRKNSFRKWLLTQFGWNILPNRHTVDKYLEVLSTYTVQDDHQGLDFYIPPAERVNLHQIWTQVPDFWIALAIGAAHPTKCLPPDRLKVLVEKIRHPIVIIGGQSENDLGTQLEQGHPDRIFNFCGKLSISGSASIINQASALITPDTGMMHIGAALQTPIISIWGSTAPVLGFTPYRAHPDSIMVEVKDLACRPCTKMGRSVCPKGHFKCMKNLPLDFIIKHLDILAKG